MNDYMKRREAFKMHGCTLVSLRSPDVMDDVMPFLDIIATPATSIVFLIPYPSGGWPWLPAQLLRMQIDKFRETSSFGVVSREVKERQKRRIRNKLGNAGELLSGKSIRTEFRIYTSSLRQAIASFDSRRDQYSVVITANESLPLVKITTGTISVLGLFEKIPWPEIIVLHRDKTLRCYGDHSFSMTWRMFASRKVNSHRAAG